MTTTAVRRPGRNEPCHCGSGRKYKVCCLTKDEVTDRAAHAVLAAEDARFFEHIGVDLGGVVRAALVNFVIVAWLVFMFSKKVLKEESVAKK